MTFQRVDIDAIKNNVFGNWAPVMRSLFPDMDPALIEKPGRKHGPCPLCGGKDRFQFFKDFETTGGANCRGCGAKSDGFEFIQQAFGCNFIEAARKVGDVLGGSYTKETPKFQQIRKEIDEKTKKRDRFFAEEQDRIHRESIPADHPDAAPLRRYLENRGLTLTSLPATLRFHPSMPSYDPDRNLEGHFPTMLAMVVDRDGNPVTWHRTFLTKDGRKAPVHAAKKLMPYPSYRDASGGAIHLSGTGPVLNVAEGIETAFAVQAMVGGSIWATVNASMMRNLQVGEPVKAVWVWSDLDRSGDGQAAADMLVARLREEGRQATRVLPSLPVPAGDKGVDWLDVYTRWHDSVAKPKAAFVSRAQRKVA